MKFKMFISLILTLFVIQSSVSFAAIQEEVTEEYKWDNIMIGGGGLVSGIVCHPKEKDLIYVRTDVGGMYRWDKESEKWIQLNNKFTDSNLYGVDGIAIDPNDTDVVYACFGKYWWNGGGIYKSTDRGATWKSVMVANFMANGIMREPGECIMVDPNNSNIVYAGTRRTGVYKSVDAGEKWIKLNSISMDDVDANFPRVFAFDNSKVENGITQVIYLGVTGQGVYKSEDAGATWENINSDIVTPYKMRVNSNTGCLYVSTNDGVYKYINGEWTDITPFRGSSALYKGMDMSSENPDTLVVTANIGNTMRFSVYITADGGTTWRDATEKYVFEKQAKYLENDNFLSNAVSVGFDPFDDSHVIVTDWFGVWETEDINAETTDWKQKIFGIEEMCPIEFVCPPTGKAHVLVGVMDNDGFPITDIYNMQERKFTDSKLTFGGPRIMTTIDVAFCEKHPEFVVRVGRTHYQTGTGSYSTDGGFTWQPFETDPFENLEGQPLTAMAGKIALSCDINDDTGFPTLLFNQGNDYPLKISKDMGKTWTVNKNISFENTGYYDRFINRIENDKVINNKFYAFKNGAIYITEDGGTTWIEGAEVPKVGKDEYFYMKSPFERQNEVWLSSWGKDLLRSFDGGKTFNSVKTASEVYSFGFGKKADDSEYPTVFIYGSVDGVKGFFRSTDYCETWTRIDDEAYKLGDVLSCIEGDRQNFGVIYAATNGTGAFYGAPKGTVVTSIENAGENSNQDVNDAPKTVSVNGIKLGENVIIEQDGKKYINLAAVKTPMKAVMSYNSDDGSVSFSREEYNLVIGFNSYLDKTIKKVMKISSSMQITVNGAMPDGIGEAKTINNNIYAELNDFMKIWGCKCRYDLSGNYIITDTKLCVSGK